MHSALSNGPLYVPVDPCSIVYSNPGLPHDQVLMNTITEILRCVSKFVLTLQRTNSYIYHVAESGFTSLQRRLHYHNLLNQHHNEVFIMTPRRLNMLLVQIETWAFCKLALRSQYSPTLQKHLGKCFLDWRAHGQSYVSRGLHQAGPV